MTAVKPKTRRTREDFTRESRSPVGLTRDEKMSIVFEYFRQGLNTNDIVTRAKADYDLKLNREDPWRLISEAARTNRLVYLAPQVAELASEFERRYPWLNRVRVVRTRANSDLSFHVAHMLLKMVQDRTKAAKRGEAEVIRIGVSGGGLIQQAFQQFAGLLTQGPTGLPKKLVFHSLVSSLDVNPSKDSTGIYSYFSQPADLGVEVEFVSVPAPGFVTKQEYRLLEKMDSIKEATRWRGKIDIVVSSIGHWKDANSNDREHSALADQLKHQKPKFFKDFLQHLAIGDFIFTPVGPTGFVDLSNFRIMSLFENKSDLSSWIERGTKVLTVAGPCGTCGQPKTEVLRCLLNLPREQRLLTDLIVDHRTAQHLLYE
jgi:hypothetical protein